MKHRTTDISTRAWHIAEKEAEIVWRRTNGNWDAWRDTLLSVYNQACQELCSNL